MWAQFNVDSFMDLEDDGGAILQVNHSKPFENGQVLFDCCSSVKTNHIDLSVGHSHNEPSLAKHQSVSTIVQDAFLVCFFDIEVVVPNVCHFSGGHWCCLPLLCNVLAVDDLLLDILWWMILLHWWFG